MLIAVLLGGLGILSSAARLAFGMGLTRLVNSPRAGMRREHRDGPAAGGVAAADPVAWR